MNSRFDEDPILRSRRVRKELAKEFKTTDGLFDHLREMDKREIEKGKKLVTAPPTAHRKHIDQQPLEADGGEEIAGFGKAREKFNAQFKSVADVTACLREWEEKHLPAPAKRSPDAPIVHRKKRSA